MNGFLFSGPNATRPAALSAAVAGGVLARTKTAAGHVDQRLFCVPI